MNPLGSGLVRLVYNYPAVKYLKVKQVRVVFYAVSLVTPVMKF